MDQETKDYLDRKILNLVRREDIEKIRQEAKVNFKMLKEESRTQWAEILEGLRVEWKRDRETRERGFAALLEQWDQKQASSLKTLQEAMQAASGQPGQERMDQMLQRLREEVIQTLLPKGEWKEEMDRLNREVADFQEGIRKMDQGVSVTGERILEGFGKIREEMGAMMRFSLADLEKRMTALESKIKAIEKMVYR